MEPRFATSPLNCSDTGCTVLVFNQLTVFPLLVRLRCGFGQLIFVIISSCFMIFKNVVHNLSLVDAELLGDYLGSKLCATCLSIAYYSEAVRFGAVAVRLRLFFQFTVAQYCSYMLRCTPYIGFRLADKVYAAAK